MTNIVEANYNPLHYCKTAARFQYDKGQVIKFNKIPLPVSYRVDFSNDSRGGNAISRLGNADGAPIPNSLFESGNNVFAFLVLSDGQEDERTRFIAEIPIKPRPRPQNVEPTPEELTIIQQAIAALNSAQMLNVYVDEDGYLKFEKGGTA